MIVKEIDLFKKGGGERVANEMGVPFLGKIPIEPEIVDSSDSGEPYVLNNKDSSASKAFAEIVKKILRKDYRPKTSE